MLTSKPFILSNNHLTDYFATGTRSRSTAWKGTQQQKIKEWLYYISLPVKNHYEQHVRNIQGTQERSFYLFQNQQNSNEQSRLNWDILQVSRLFWDSAREGRQKDRRHTLTSRHVFCKQVSGQHLCIHAVLNMTANFTWKH